MNNETIERFKGDSSGTKALALLESRKMDLEKLMKDILTNVQESIPHMNDTEKCSTEQLCGPELWESLGTGPRRAAGMCLVFLVQEKIVPLFPHYANGDDGKNYYCKQPSQRPNKPRIRRLDVKSTGG